VKIDEIRIMGVEFGGESEEELKTLFSISREFL
jgi:hypothetical protein